MKRALFLGCFLFFMLIGCSDPHTEGSKQTDETETQRTEVLISAAASLTDALDEIKEVYEKKNTEVTLNFNFAGSGKLAQQIQQGAPADVFISANEDWMQTLIGDGLIRKGDRVEVTGNKLVAIVHKPSPWGDISFSDLTSLNLGQIAIGNPDSVPAGEYAEEVLKNEGNWEELEEQFVYAKDVRQVLTYVETGNAQVGFVYESDAQISDEVVIVAYADANDHEPIVYPAAVVHDSKFKDIGNDFLQFLKSDTGQAILEKYGFTNN